MSAPVFSITKPDGSKIQGTEVDGKMVDIYLGDDLLADAGLITQTGGKALSTIKFLAPQRINGQNYTFSANDSGIDPDTAVADDLYVNLDKTGYGVFTSEGLDSGLFTKTGEVRGNVIKSLGAIAKNSMVLDWMNAVKDEITANKDTQALVLPTITTSTMTSATAGQLVEQIEKVIRDYRTKPNAYREILPNDQIRVLVSYEYVDKLKKAFGVLKRTPEYIENPYTNMKGKYLSISGIPLIPFQHLGINIPSGANGLHKTKSADMSNFQAICLSRFSIKAPKGNVEMWETKAPKTNNPINGTKCVYGIKVWDTFKLDIFGIVDTAIV